jgi:[ribosomal protein S5]-alanine N-acetyltransferase
VADLEQVLSTDRLTLEPIVPQHATRLFEKLKDERLYRFHGGQPASETDLKRRFEKWQARKSPDGSQTWLNYALKRKEDGSYVGWVQATIAGKVATLGYDIFAEHWRRGYAREACLELIQSLFQEHGVICIVAVADSENVPSIRLLEALGFTLAWTGPSQDMPGRQDCRYELR